MNQQLTPYQSGAASPLPLELRSDQWLFDQHRNALRMRRQQPHRKEWWNGRIDALRAEIRARTGQNPSQELDR